MKAKLKSQEKTLQSLKVNLKNSLRTRFLICKFITFISKLIKESEQAYRNSITDMQNTINKYDSKESINEAKLNQANLEKKQLEFELSQTKHQIDNCEAQLKQQKGFLEKRTKDMEQKLKFYESLVQTLKVNFKNSLRTRFRYGLFYHFY